MTGTLVHTIANLALVIPVILICLSVHEAAHAGMAYLLGDDTAKKMGRISLNPLAHIDPIGFVTLLIFRIGWAKPVMFNPVNFKRPKLYSILTAFAGPISNFLLALGALVGLRFIPFALFSKGIAVKMIQFLKELSYFNVMLGVFNFMPIPPLDGGHLLLALLSEYSPRAAKFLYRYSLFILIFFIFFPPTQRLLSQLFERTYHVLISLIF